MIKKYNKKLKKKYFLIFYCIFLFINIHIYKKLRG